MSDWYKMNPVDWNDGTDDLTLEQEAAYLRICHAIYITERPVRDNAFVIAGLLRCNERKAKRLLAELVAAGKLVIEDGGISNQRAVEEVSNRVRIRMERKSAGSRGGVESANTRAKALKSNEQAQAIGSTSVEPDKIREEEKIEPIAQHLEPARAPDLADQLLEAAGIRGNPNPSLAFPGPVISLLDAGYDLHLDILPALRSKPKPDARSWTYFVPQIEEYRKRRLGAVQRVTPDPLTKLAAWPVERWQVVLDQFRTSGHWPRETYGPRPGEPGCLVPVEMQKARAA